MSALEQELMSKIRHLSEAQQKRVLEFVRELEQPRRYTARELMALPLAQRQRLVEEAIEASANENFEIFE